MFGLSRPPPRASARAPPRASFDSTFAKVFESRWRRSDISRGAWRWRDDLRLVLLRHAKSDWSDDTLPDKRRPLAAKGRRRAVRCATRLDERAWTPDLILTSDATRCLETLEAMGDAVEAFRTAPVILVPDFYDKTHGDEGDVSQAKSAKVIGKRVGVEVGLGTMQPRTVMCVGHNFGFELAARSFCGSANVELKTAHAALLTARGPARRGERAFKVIVAPLDDTALAFEVWTRELRGSTSVMFCVCDVAVCAVIDDAPPERNHHDDAWQRAFTDHKFRLEAVLNPEEPESASEIIKRVVERMIEELIDSDMSSEEVLERVIAQAESVEDAMSHQSRALGSGDFEIEEW